MSWINIYTPEEWGAVHGSGWYERDIPVDYIILHHSETNQLSETATVEQEMEEVRYIESIGYKRFSSADYNSKGELVWKPPTGAGISYTWVVAPSGRVYAGHDPKRQSSHTSGFNTNGVGIALIGNYVSRVPTAKQIEAVARLMLQAKDDGIIVEPVIDYGHSQVYSTACPGSEGMKAIAKINSRVKELQGGGEIVPIVDNKGFTVNYIKEVQQALTTLGLYSGDIHGLLDAGTDKAIRDFQAANNLTVDGLPGNNTKTALDAKVRELAERLAREEAERLERERRISELVASVRLSGADRWATARAVATASLPTGRGVILAPDGSADERYATARASENVRYLPVRLGNDAPPAQTAAALRELQPDWVRVVGGGVTDACTRSILETAGLI